MFLQKQPYKKIFYSFIGWKNEGIKMKFNGSIDFWGEEVLAKRTLPEAPQGVVVIRTKENEIDGIGTPLGAHIEVHYYDVEGCK